MRKMKLAVATMVIAAGAFGTYAFTNANNSENEKAKVENVYHYLGENEDGEIIFALGEPTLGDCEDPVGKPCRFTSSTPLTSPMTAEDIQAQATVTNWKE